MTDQEFEACIQQIREGKKEGLKSIYQAYLGLIYSVIYDLLGQIEDTQDVTAEFFIRLWEKADTYRFGGKHRAWMITIARNMAIDFLRKYKKEVIVEELPEPEAGREDFAAQLVGTLTLQEAVAQLRPAEQEVLDLKVMGEFTFEEIAALLKKPMGTVTWLYQQAIQKLKSSQKDRRCGNE